MDVFLFLVLSGCRLRSTGAGFFCWQLRFRIRFFALLNSGYMLASFFGGCLDEFHTFHVKGTPSVSGSPLSGVCMSPGGLHDFWGDDFRNVRIQRMRLLRSHLGSGPYFYEPLYPAVPCSVLCATEE